MDSTTLAYFCEMAAHAWDVPVFRGTAVASAMLILSSDEASWLESKNNSSVSCASCELVAFKLFVVLWPVVV